MIGRKQRVHELAVRDVIARRNIQELENNSGGRFFFFRQRYPSGIMIGFHKSAISFGQLLTDDEIGKAPDISAWIDTRLDDIRREVVNRIYNQSPNYIDPQRAIELDDMIREHVSNLNDCIDSGSVDYGWDYSDRVSVSFSCYGYTYCTDEVPIRELSKSNDIRSTIDKLYADAFEKVQEYHRKSAGFADGLR